MAKIIKFPRSGDRTQQRIHPHGTAEVILFTGVRYERLRKDPQRPGMLRQQRTEHSGKA